MAVQIERGLADEFCPRLFRVLDELGLLPRQLRAKPTEFEKYPRLLFGSIQRYNDVDAGFREWESRILRVAEFRREERYPDLEELRRWMNDQADFFTNKANMQHLRTSLLSRVFQYLYPRRVLANAFCQQYKGNKEAIAKFQAVTSAKDASEREARRQDLEEWFRENLPSSIEASVQKLKELYNDDEWQVIADDACKSLSTNVHYYLKVLTGKEPLEAEPEPEELEEEFMEEDTND
ncbi:hypothetical protein Spith_0692 [Spirochaeta thermophila DSM 6578]|uniref:Uncharacterized protein n=1 Tax=Winmispira thermophila (strain ATCC 700085 / DSM 6578 / Z-1203) TaxID=869211 RepID=G0GAK6_WINT7|nr:hypothetical protein [Spirochaeta thermophila]AEJ60971.1 hypothetical protein Spith_0692 [Spirochaeta thermophila DSM 6578]